MKPYSEADSTGWFRLFRLCREIFRTVLKRSPYVDTFSSWLLLVAGVAAGFLVSHLAEVQKFVSAPVSTRIHFCIALSAACGFAQKTYAIIVANAVAIEEEIMAQLPIILGGNPEAEPSADQVEELTRATIQEMREAAPWWIRWLVSRGARKGAADPLFALKRTMRQFHRQYIFCLGQLGFLVTGLIILTIGFSQSNQCGQSDRHPRFRSAVSVEQ